MSTNPRWTTRYIAILVLYILLAIILGMVIV